MSQEDALVGPDWDSPVQVTLTPALMIHALMSTATAVHTAWESCIDEGLVVSSLVAMDDGPGHYVRLVEQEYDDDNDPETAWHDWTLEIRIGRVLTTGHWQVPVGGALLEWEWHAREAEQAFERACVLLGRRVGRGLTVVEPQPSAVPARSTRH